MAARKTAIAAHAIQTKSAMFMTRGGGPGAKEYPDAHPVKAYTSQMTSTAKASGSAQCSRSASGSSRSLAALGMTGSSRSLAALGMTAGSSGMTDLPTSSVH